MFKVTVLKMKDILRISIGLILTIVVVLIISKNFRKGIEGVQIKDKLSNLKVSMCSLIKFNGTDCVKKTLPTVASIDEGYDEKLEENKPEEKNVLHEMLKTQISSIDGIEQAEKNLKNEENANNVNVENNTEEEIQMAQTGLSTQVVTNNPISEKYNTQYESVKIKNETSYELTEDILNPDITIDNKNIVLFHTHSCESYTPSEKYPYTQTGNFRTTDLDFTVTRVGTELENQLKQYNYNVVHSTAYHDYPAYNGSYTRSLATVESILQTTPADIIMDVHRDAIGSRSDYAPTVKIGDTDEAAQIMFVVGTDEGGLWHPNWQQNLKFAIKIQQKAEEMYPGLFKPLMLTKSRYNQHAGKYANIIEVGATGNTLEQCLNSMKYLARVMDEVLKNT